MEGKKLAKIVIGSAIVAGAITLIAYFKRQAELLYNSCFKVIWAKNLKLSLNSGFVTLRLLYMNKSEISLTITKQVYDVYINGYKVTTLVNNNPSVINAGAKNIIDIDISFVPKDIFFASLANLSVILNDPKKLMVEIKGKLSVRSGILFFKDLHYNTKMTLGEILTPNPNADNC